MCIDGVHASISTRPQKKKKWEGGWGDYGFSSLWMSNCRPDGDLCYKTERIELKERYYCQRMMVLHESHKKGGGGGGDVKLGGIR